jgi:hypothetical protein
MDVAIEANKNSPLLTSLGRQLRTDISYKFFKNYPNVSLQKTAVSANKDFTSSPHGQEFYFKLPKNMLCTNMLIQSTIKTAGDNGGSGTNASYQQTVGLDLFENIELRSNNKVLCSNSDVYLRCRVDNSDFSKGNAMLRRALMFSTDKCTPTVAWSAVSIVTYTPVLFSFFEHPSMSIDLSLWEQLQVRCVVNSAARFGTAQPLSELTSVLWLYGYNMQTDHLEEIRTRNFGGNSTMQMLIYDQYVETATMGSTATLTTVNLACKNPVFATHLLACRSDAGGLKMPFNITSYTVRFAGKSVLDSVIGIVGDYDSDLKGGYGNTRIDRSAGATNGALREYPSKSHCIWWGMEHNERKYNTGSLSLNNVNAGQILLTTAAPSNTTTDYFIVHEYWSLLSINQSNGVAEINLSI